MIKNKKGLIFKNALFALIVVGIAIYGIGVWVGNWSE